MKKYLLTLILYISSVAAQAQWLTPSRLFDLNTWSSQPGFIGWHGTSTNTPTSGLYGSGIQMVLFGDDRYGTQLVAPTFDNSMFYRNNEFGNWTPWYKIWSTANFDPDTYLDRSALYITGAGAANNFINGYTFAYAASGTPWNGSLVSLGGFGGSYDTQINADYGPNGGGHMSFRTRDGDHNDSWNNWYELYHSGNLNRNDVDFTARNFNSINAFISGNVGIGTPTPLYKLHVSGGDIGIDQPYAFKFANGQTIADDNGGGLKINSLYGISNVVHSGRFYTINGGNVGIGTTSPASTFQVDDGCSKASIGNAGGSQVLNWGTSYLGFNASRSGTSWLTNSDGGNNGGGVIYGNIFGDMYFSIIPNTTGASGQNVNDQDIADNIALKISHTDGAVYAKKVFVQATGIPDYVFKNNYNLTSLSDLKTYIDKNHHLPEVPSEKEVAEKGLNLGEMNKTLLKKVEELTLYLIEKDKVEKDQSTKIEQQQQSLQQQQDLTKKLMERLDLLEKKIVHNN